MTGPRLKILGGVSIFNGLRREPHTLGEIRAGMAPRPVRSTLSQHIAGGHVPVADQPAGVGNNSQQPVHGVPRCGGQEEPRLPASDGDTFRCGSGQSHEEPNAETIGGALEGETDYLEAHDLVDWGDAPFAATAWTIIRGRPSSGNADPTPKASWLWIGADGKVTGSPAPDYGVILHPGRGMTIKRPPGLEEWIKA